MRAVLKTATAAKMPAPTVHIIAGPNGAGKTTFAREFLAGEEGGKNFLNADLIAAGLSPLAPGTMELRAGRLLLERWKELAAARLDFSFETTMSGKTYAGMLRKLKDGGYRFESRFSGWRKWKFLFAASGSGSKREGTMLRPLSFNAGVHLESATFSTFTCLLPTRRYYSTLPRTIP